jgi:hypothetical protein
MPIPDYGKYQRFGTHMKRSIKLPHANRRFDSPIGEGKTIAQTGYDMTRENTTGDPLDTIRDLKALITPPEPILVQSIVGVTSDKFDVQKNTTDSKTLTNTDTKAYTKMIDGSGAVIQNLAEIECKSASRSMTWNGTPAVTALSSALAGSSKMIPVADPKKPFRLYTVDNKPAPVVGGRGLISWSAHSHSQVDSGTSDGSASYNHSGTIPATILVPGVVPDNTNKKYVLYLSMAVAAGVSTGSLEYIEYSPSISSSLSGSASALAGLASYSSTSQVDYTYWGHWWCYAGHYNWNIDLSTNYSQTTPFYSIISWDGSYPALSYTASGNWSLTGAIPGTPWSVNWSSYFTGSLIEIG